MKLRNIAIAGLVSVTLFSCNDLEEYNPSGATSEAGSDLWYNRDKDSYANQLTYYSGLGPSTGNPNRAAWTRFWKGINQCNAGINRIDQAGFTNEAEKNKRLAELRFMRAFYYWH